MESGAAEPDAESNLARVQVARVREFREKNLLLADEDFAYMPLLPTRRRFWLGATSLLRNGRASGLIKTVG